MSSILLNKKQKLSFTNRYGLYLSQGPKPKNKLSNRYNLFDDLNSNDLAFVEIARNYIEDVNVTSEISG
ncbi:MAG TPA: hypothetical protein VLF63_02085 [Patescibacteria group bacterium]|nr:hypothetical protein [Patescibacteria group bacterium]